jgi:hypothetical protein
MFADRVLLEPSMTYPRSDRQKLGIDPATPLITTSVTIERSARAYLLQDPNNLRVLEIVLRELIQPHLGVF